MAGRGGKLLDLEPPQSSPRLQACPWTGATGGRGLQVQAKRKPPLVRGLEAVSDGRGKGRAGEPGKAH